MIYAIHAKGSGAVKFGVAKSVERRMYAHQVSCPLELEILATADWPNEAERIIHNILRRQSVRGEWFEYKGPALAIVNAMAAGEDVAALSTIAIGVVRPDHRLAKITEHALRLSVAGKAGA